MGSRNRDCNRQLAICVGLSFSAGLGVTVGGWILTFVILLTTRPLHGAGPLAFYTCLIAPAIGIGVALLALRHWRRLRSKEPENPLPTARRAAGREQALTGNRIDS